MFKVLSREVTSLLDLSELKSALRIDWGEHDEMLADLEASCISELEKYLKFPITKCTAVKRVRLATQGYINEDPDKLELNRGFSFQAIPVNTISEIRAIKGDETYDTLQLTVDYSFDSVSNTVKLQSANRYKFDGREYLEIYCDIGWSTENIPAIVQGNIKSLAIHMYDKADTPIPTKLYRPSANYRYYG